jgi:hypothetical protein
MDSSQFHMVREQYGGSLAREDCSAREEAEGGNATAQVRQNLHGNFPAIGLRHLRFQI